MSPADPVEVVRDDRAGLAEAVARDLLGRLAEVQQRGEVPQVALTGGSVADAVHREVARLVGRGEADGHATDVPVVDWSRVEVFWGDERFLAPGDQERNEVQAREALLDHVPVDPARVHPVPSTADAGDVHEAARAYAEVVRAAGAGAFDVVMLGLGPDGHIASLFPGHDTVGVVDAIAVAETDSPKPPPERVSLTLPALARTRAVWFVVAGEEKADAVARTRSGRHSAAETPAVGLLSAPEVRWYLDTAAAGA